MKKTEAKFPLMVNLNSDSNNHLKEIIDSTNLSKTGALRIAIDCLYYEINNETTPLYLKEILKKLKK